MGADGWTLEPSGLDSDPITVPERYLVFPAGQERPAGFVGAVVKVLSATRTPFTLFAAPRPDERVAMARLLALAALDSRWPLIFPTMMPRRPGLAVLRDDGTFRHQVTRTFDKHVSAEVRRLSRQLLPDAEAILEELRVGRKSRLREPDAQDFFTVPDPDLHEIDLPATRPDLSAIMADQAGMSRHHLVRRDYERDRFMRYLPRPDLDGRARVTIRGLYKVDGDGRATAGRGLATQFWIDRATEVMHEYGLRGISPAEYGPVMASEEALRSNTPGVFRAAGGAIRSASLPDRPYLVKYGALEHLKILQRGRLRLAGAGSYSDASLDPARRDEELQHAVEWDPSILPFAGPDQSPSYLIRPSTPRIRTSMDSPTDFYVCCLARSLRARLFNDFRSSAALVISDPTEFHERFRRAVEIAFPGWSVRAGPVTYYDPLNTSPSEVSFPFWKSFAYAYQEEARLTMEPPAQRSHLPPVFLRIGPLEDISQLITLNPTGAV